MTNDERIKMMNEALAHHIRQKRIDLDNALDSQPSIASYRAGYLDGLNHAKYIVDTFGPKPSNASPS